VPLVVAHLRTARLQVHRICEFEVLSWFLSYTVLSVVNVC
jgi:hypothetical protein